MSFFDTDLYVDGSISASGTISPTAGSITNDHISAGAAITRAKMASEVIPFGIPLTCLKQSDAQKTVLPDAADSTDLGLAAAVGSVVVGTTTNNTTKTEKAVAFFALPAEYADAGAITVRVRAKTSAARQVSAGVDIVAKLLADGALGSDLCTTAAQVLTTSWVNYDFTISPTSRVAGDMLMIEITLTSDDTGGSTNGYSTMTKLDVRCNCKG
jgi:hypothetical protein